MDLNCLEQSGEPLWSAASNGLTDTVTPINQREGGVDHLTRF